MINSDNLVIGRLSDRLQDFGYSDYFSTILFFFKFITRHDNV